MTTTQTPPAQERTAASARGSRTWQQSLRVIFHVVAIAEAITWAGLLYSMYARYVLDNDGPMAIWGIGHGIAFMVFCAVVTLCWFTFRWKLWEWAVAIVFAIPPLMTIILDIWYHRTGKLKA